MTEAEGRFKFKDYRARQCTLDDFGIHNKAKDFVATWEGFSLLCPDIPKGDGLLLQGTSASMISKNFSFNI